METIKINGMHCGHCVASVTKSMEDIDGVSNVQVDLDKGEATYTSEKDVAIDIIKEAITKIGFEVAE